MDRVTFPDGRTFVTHDCLLRGDYVGAGSVGVANIHYVLAQFEGRVEDWGYGELSSEAGGREGQLVRIRGASGYPQDYRHEWQHRTPEPEAVCLHVTGHYGHEAVYLLEGNEDGDEILAALADYPCLDEEGVSKVELEWEYEAWENWLCQDLIATLSDEPEVLAQYEEPSLREWAEDTDDSVLYDAYRAAMEECNEYPIPEDAGVHVHIGRIAPAFEKHLRRLREAELDGPDALKQISLPLEAT